jgi:hypothetical protein
MCIGQGRINDLERYIAAAQGAAKPPAALTHRLLAISRQQTLEAKLTDINRLVAGLEELVRRTVGPEIVVEIGAANGLWSTLTKPFTIEVLATHINDLIVGARPAGTISQVR